MERHMNTIAAIDTIYKGYRFRSRLEARWALFFDLAEMRWEYEVEPIKVNGEAYLPDFKLAVPELREPVYLEVKPDAGGYFSWPRVYLAGKCSKQDEWRGDAANGGDENSENSHWASAETFVTMNGASFLKCGPFPANCHGYPYDSPHATGVTRSVIVEQCQNAISHADLFCVHISTMDAFGTLVEIGFAKGFGIPTSFTITKEMIEKGRFDSLEPTAWTEQFPRHDLWFAETLVASWSGCKVARVSDDAEARAFHAEFIRENTAREIRLITGLAAQHGPVSIVFGDPFKISGAGLCLWNRFNLPRFVKANIHHAEAARAYRFDRR